MTKIHHIHLDHGQYRVVYQLYVFIAYHHIMNITIQFALHYLTIFTSVLVITFSICYK